MADPANPRQPITIAPELQQQLEAKVASGRYSSADQVLREALSLLDERDERLNAALDDVRAKVRAGLAAADRGELTDGDEFFAELEREEQANRQPRDRKSA